MSLDAFRRRLAEGPVAADGGVGALLAARLARLRCPEEANIAAPEAVLEVHLEFIRAGAELISANTFGANRTKLAGHRLDDRLTEIAEGGVKLAREAREVSGKPLFVAGSIGPSESPGGEAYESVAEQARLLEGRGVDLFLLETLSDLDELVAAVTAVRGVSSLPVVCMLTFDEGGETLAGVRARDVVERLAPLGIDAVGANCGLGPQAALDALAEMAEPARAAGLPLAAKPNAGLPSRVAGRLVYPNATPDYFAEFAAQAVSLGARIVGGCCGTGPAQVAAIKVAIDENRKPRVPLRALDREPPPAPPAERDHTRLERMLAAGEWVVCVELDPPKGTNLESLLDAAARLRDSGLVHAVDVNDNPMGRARMSALTASAVIQRTVGIETIPHVTPRDATIMGLESQLLGAHAEGIRNILAVTGDPPHVGDYPGSHGVYEVDSIGLAHILSRLNDGTDHAGRAIDQPASFHIGVAVNPTADDLPTEIDRLYRKIDAGARFAMTQALFDITHLDRLLDKLGGDSPIPLLAGIWPLRSHQLALRLHNEVPGITVPDPVQQALADAGPDAPKAGLEIARQLLDQARTRVAGIYIIPPFNEPAAALELLAS